MAQPDPAVLGPGPNGAVRVVSNTDTDANQAYHCQLAYTDEGQCHGSHYEGHGIVIDLPAACVDVSKRAIQPNYATNTWPSLSVPTEITLTDPSTGTVVAHVADAQDFARTHSHPLGQFAWFLTALRTFFTWDGPGTVTSGSTYFGTNVETTPTVVELPKYEVTITCASAWDGSNPPTMTTYSNTVTIP